MELADSINAPLDRVVDPDLVMDIDIYAVPVKDCDLGRTWLDIKAAAPSPIVWTNRNGGHWIALHGADIKAIHSAPSYFSSTDIFIPPNGSRDNMLIPLEMDPPEGLEYRKILVPALMPGRLAAVSDVACSTTTELIEGFKPKGGCEFVGDFSLVLPMVVFLTLMGLPLEDREYMISLAKKSVRPDSAEDRLAGHQGLAAYLQPHIDDRKANPRDDFLSQHANATIGGRPIGDFEARQFVLNTTIGGLDTVANLLGFVMHFLANSADHRRQLVERPELINSAADEFLRRFGIVGQGRRIMQDTELNGVSVRKGDMIVAPTWMYGLDDAIVPDPLTVDFERRNPPSMTFGGGPHVCPGMHLARRELRIMLEQWLPRIPDFRVQDGSEVKVETGIVNGITRLHLQW